MNLKRECLGWNRPFCSVFAEYLKGIAAKGTELDECLIWVPSSRAGRHILNELFSGQGEEQEGIHPPVFLTPARFIGSLVSEHPSAASELQCLLAWKRVLCRVHPESLHGLFPFIPDGQPQQWGYSIGQQLLRLKGQLGEEALSMSELAGRVRSSDRERWQVLERLEKDYLKELAGQSLADPDALIVGKLPELLKEVPYKRILVAGILNLSPRQINCLEVLAGKGLEVELFLPVPANREKAFDEWGRPLAEAWNKEAIPGTLLEDRIYRSPEPRELVESVLELADGYRENVDALVVGSPGEDIGDYLVERSRLSRTPFYAPVGKPLARTGFGRLLLVLEEVLKTGNLSNLRELFHNALFRGWVIRSGFRAESLETDLLMVQQEHFLHFREVLSDPSLDPIGGAGRIRDLFGELEKLLAPENTPADFTESIWNFLQHVAQSNNLTDSGRAVLGQLEEILQDMKEQVSLPDSTDQDYWELLRYALENTVHYPEREAEQRPVSGWLELPWETAPHLLILGLPDAAVPGSAGMDTFLTPGLRNEAGLRTPEEESAFHACRLRIILEARRDFGRVDILLPERGLDDAPSQPSRFLFLSPEEELLDRVHTLLDSLTTKEHALPANFGCALSLPEPSVPESVSVTGFRAYLQNPFQYYIERQLRWRAPESLPREMDSLGFGILAHDVLEAFNASDSGRNLQSEKDIRAFLEETLEETVAGKFGSRLAFPLKIQVDSMRERLCAAVPDLSRSRKEGWIPREVEWSWHKEYPFPINGMPVHGKIDLLEWNESENLYRVVDYKTSDKSDSPATTHMSKLNSNSAPSLFPECEFESAGKHYRWKDLQLPLYQLAVKKAFGAEVTSAYFNLAKTVNDVGLKEHRFSESDLAAALKCAEAIIERIREGEFPISTSKRFEDPWLSWFGKDYKALDSVWNPQGEEDPS